MAIWIILKALLSCPCFFVNNAYGTDNFNGGFFQGSTDRYVFLHGMIQRQLILGERIYLCMIDFPKAFDLVNRNILFYKIITFWLPRKNTRYLIQPQIYFQVNSQGLTSLKWRGTPSPAYILGGGGGGGIILHVLVVLCISKTSVALS